ncbi:MAG: beta-ketoacyl-[acyl-carrier-protein] synthase family protein [Candidatus Omnitrophica bacterium]|nr:beta-ketoacyl-[acyl-carrier-protein] synthase family protein [Candidatus Omnitrophota bacterium]
MKRRVVVTGLGIVSSIGIGKDEFWKNLIDGKSGISKVTAFDISNYDIQRGGEIKNFDPINFIPKSRLRDFGRASQFAVAATKEALNDTGLKTSQLSKNKIAVIFGTTMGEGGMIEEIDRHWAALGEDDVWAITVSKYQSSAISNNVNRFFKLKGMSVVIPTACAAGNYSVGYGYDLIREKMVNCALIGGSDPFSRIGFTGFGRLYAMSPNLCKPFDKDRKGMMVGEGAAVLILEELESARKRGANIYAEILGYGLSCDAYHMTIPSLKGIKKVMIKTMKNAGIKPNDVDYISAHGTGTIPNDKTECQAIKEVFGNSSKKLPPVSSIKSMLGHTMGAASAIEALSCCLAIKEGIIPPTINFETPDPECDIDCVPNKARKVKLNTVLNNSFAFGGNNACTAFGKPANKIREDQ